MKEEELLIVLHEISPDASDMDGATQFSARPISVRFCVRPLDFHRGPAVVFISQVT